MLAVELSEYTNTNYVAMDMYETLFMLVGRSMLSSSMMTEDKINTRTIF